MRWPAAFDPQWPLLDPVATRFNGRKLIVQDRPHKLPISQTGGRSVYLKNTEISLTPCPKCRSGMIHVSITPHPINPGMRRNTFVCRICNQTRTYMLPTPTGESVASA
jgi:hypothetical protein